MSSASSSITACSGRALEEKVRPPTRVIELRAARWSSLPAAPGVYWWFFPQVALEHFHITRWCDPTLLRLRSSEEGRVCLYHGRAKNLRQRIEWHAAQALRMSALRSGILSTFRFTLLALNDFDYAAGSSEVDRYMDGLDVVWQALPSVEAATEHELNELAAGTFHYPLNIQDNRHPELSAFIQRVKDVRRAYKRRFLEGMTARTSAGARR